MGQLSVGAWVKTAWASKESGSVAAYAGLIRGFLGVNSGFGFADGPGFGRGSLNAGVFLEIGSDGFFDHTAYCHRHHGDVAGRGWNATTHQNTHQGGHDQRKQQLERLSGYAKAQAGRGRNPVDYC